MWNRILLVFCSLLSLVFSQTECPIITGSDLGNTTDFSNAGLIVNALAFAIQGGLADNIKLVNYSIVCLAQGAVEDRFRMVSVVTTYYLNGGTTLTLSQFHFSCDFDFGVWSTDVLGSFDNSLTRSGIMGNLTTPLRRDCRACADIGPGFSATEHCYPCSSSCDTGLRACTNLAGDNCCYFFGINGSCVLECPDNSTSNSDFKCKCNLGFMPHNNKCMEINECLLNPCQNGGNCNSLLNDYSCECMAGYTDKNCSTDINECSTGPCENGGTCTDLVNDYSCLCLAGYTDDNCSTNINECFSSPCVNGTCHDLVNDYKCECAPGFSDKNCSTDVDECLINPCDNGSTCMDLINEYACICSPGYTDINCTTDVNKCSTNPCQNGGSCNNLINDYTCICLPGYTDRNCSTDINECMQDPCQNGAECNDLINGYSCGCILGYTGKNCDTNIDDCIPNRCQNDGVCTDSVNNFTCICFSPWYGHVCEQCNMPHCLICLHNMTNNQTNCTTCTQGYTFNSATNMCECDLKNCLTCSDTGLCEECEKSFQLLDDGKLCSPITGSSIVIIIIMISVLSFALGGISVGVIMALTLYKLQARRKHKKGSARIQKDAGMLANSHVVRECEYEDLTDYALPANEIYLQENVAYSKVQ